MNDIVALSIFIAYISVCCMSLVVVIWVLVDSWMLGRRR